MPSDPTAPVFASSTRTLLSWEVAMIGLFVRAANLIGLPRSVGRSTVCCVVQSAH